MHWDIFVYGTLRRGGANHHYLRRAAFLGPARTATSGSLYVEAGIPYLVADEPRYPVTGECYRVDARTLAELDDLEEHPHVYRRREDDVVLGDGSTIRAWIYFAQSPHGRLLPSGDFAGS